MYNSEIVRFYNDGLYDFKPYILADVFDQLLIAGDYHELQIVCAGAFVDGKPVGAAVAQLLENNEVYLQSIMVDKKYRLQNIGTELLNGILSEAYAEFSEDNDLEVMPTRVFLHTDYTLPKDAVEGFDNFLRKFGFTDFYEMEDCCYIKGTKLMMPQGFVKPENILSIASDAIGLEEELAEFCSSEQIFFDPKNAFMLIDGNTVKAIIVAENGMDRDYYLREYEKVDITDAEFDQLFYALVQQLQKTDEHFVFIVDKHNVMKAGHLEELSKGCCTLFAHKEAGFYGVFDNPN